MVNWRADTEKRLNNLLRFMVQDVTARGDASALADDPRVVSNADGSFTVVVFKSDPTPNPSPSNGEGLQKAVKKKVSKKVTAE